MPRPSFRILFCCSLFALLSACGETNKLAPKQRPPTPVNLASPLLEAVADTTEVLGSSQSWESVDITANVSETIDTIHFQDGERVKKGQILVTLTQRNERALLDQALANLEEQERELKRVQLLAAKRSVPESELDSRQTQVVIARQKVKEARATLADLTLRAPFDGLLGLKKISPGALVSPGTVITTLDQLERIKLDFSVPAIFAAELKPGLPISATSPALPGFHFEGIVHSVDARIDTNSRSVLARAELNNADEMIRPGMLMHISLRRNPRQALTLPESAIVSRQTRHFVWRVNADNQVNLVAVSLGTRRAGRVEVKNGLVPDDQVVIDGVHRISEGQTIAVAEPPALARQ